MQTDFIPSPHNINSDPQLKTSIDNTAAENNARRAAEVELLVATSDGHASPIPLEQEPVRPKSSISLITEGAIATDEAEGEKRTSEAQQQHHHQHHLKSDVVAKEQKSSTFLFVPSDQSGSPGIVAPEATVAFVDDADKSVDALVMANGTGNNAARAAAVSASVAFFDDSDDSQGERTDWKRAGERSAETAAIGTGTAVVVAPFSPSKETSKEEVAIGAVNGSFLSAPECCDTTGPLTQQQDPNVANAKRTSQLSNHNLHQMLERRSSSNHKTHNIGRSGGIVINNDTPSLNIINTSIVSSNSLSRDLGVPHQRIFLDTPELPPPLATAAATATETTATTVANPTAVTTLPLPVEGSAADNKNNQPAAAAVLNVTDSSRKPSHEDHFVHEEFPELEEESVENKYSVLLQTLLIVCCIIGAKLIMREYIPWEGEVELSEISLVFTGLFFILGQMFTIVNADLKEAEKMPMDVIASLDQLEDAFLLVAGKVQNKVDMLEVQTLLVEFAHNWRDMLLQENGKTYGDCLNTLFALAVVVRNWDMLGAANSGQPLVVIDKIRRVIGRGTVIKRTDVLPAATALLNFFVLMSCLLLFLATYKTEVALAVVMACVMTVCLFMARLLDAMDDPFHLKPPTRWQRWLYGHMGSVQLFPILEYIVRVERRMKDRFDAEDAAAAAAQEEAARGGGGEAAPPAVASCRAASPGGGGGLSMDNVTSLLPVVGSSNSVACESPTGRPRVCSAHFLSPVLLGSDSKQKQLGLRGAHPSNHRDDDEADEDGYGKPCVKRNTTLRGTTSGGQHPLADAPYPPQRQRRGSNLAINTNSVASQSADEVFAFSPVGGAPPRMGCAPAVASDPIALGVVSDDPLRSALPAIPGGITPTSFTVKSNKPQPRKRREEVPLSTGGDDTEDYFEDGAAANNQHSPLRSHAVSSGAVATTNHNGDASVDNGSVVFSGSFSRLANKFANFAAGAASRSFNNNNNNRSFYNYFQTSTRDHNYSDVDNNNNNASFASTRHVAVNGSRHGSVAGLSKAERDEIARVKKSSSHSNTSGGTHAAAPVSEVLLRRGSSVRARALATLRHSANRSGKSAVRSPPSADASRSEVALQQRENAVNDTAVNGGMASIASFRRGGGGGAVFAAPASASEHAVVALVPPVAPPNLPPPPPAAAKPIATRPQAGNPFPPFTHVEVDGAGDVSFTDTYSILIQTLLVVCCFIGIKLLLREYVSWKGEADLSEISVVFTGLFFIMGQMFSNVNSELKEAEKMPMDVVSSLDQLQDHFIMGASKIPGKAKVSDMQKLLLEFARTWRDMLMSEGGAEEADSDADDDEAVTSDDSNAIDHEMKVLNGAATHNAAQRSNQQQQRKAKGSEKSKKAEEPSATYGDCLNCLADLMDLMRDWENKGGVNLTYVPLTVDKIRRSIGRGTVIQRTDVLPAAGALLNFFVLMSCLLLFLATYKTEVVLALLIACVMTVCIFMARVIHSMDDPFKMKEPSLVQRWLVGHMSAVPIFPLLEYIDRMERFVAATEEMEERLAAEQQS